MFVILILVAEFEDHAEDNKSQVIISKWYNVALLSEMHNVDLICIAYNTYNWSPSNWHYQNFDIENFYRRGNSYSRIDYSIVRDYTDIPIEWPLMNHNMGRWQTLETLPQELQKLVSHCPCGKCAKCKCREWYNKNKKEGFSAEELDDLIMKEGKYGKYYTKESIPQTRHDAYADQRFPVWSPAKSNYKPLPPKPHNK